jgi:hypothetical protein
VVKLYDLTTVCSDMEKNFSEQNPFTVPLGMLLYRVARKMWTDQKLAKTALIRTLLENCLCLLDEKKHSQVYLTSVLNSSILDKCNVLAQLFKKQGELLLIH